MAEESSGTISLNRSKIVLKYMAILTVDMMVAIVELCEKNQYSKFNKTSKFHIFKK